MNICAVNNNNNNNKVTDQTVFPVTSVILCQDIERSATSSRVVFNVFPVCLFVVLISVVEVENEVRVDDRTLKTSLWRKKVLLHMPWLLLGNRHKQEDPATICLWTVASSGSQTLVHITLVVLRLPEVCFFVCFFFLCFQTTLTK